jgi:hypothetical protein
VEAVALFNCVRAVRNVSHWPWRCDRRAADGHRPAESGLEGSPQEYAAAKEAQRRYRMFMEGKVPLLTEALEARDDNRRSRLRRRASRRTRSCERTTWFASEVRVSLTPPRSLASDAACSRIRSPHARTERRAEQPSAPGDEPPNMAGQLPCCKVRRWAALLSRRTSVYSLSCAARCAPSAARFQCAPRLLPRPMPRAVNKRPVDRAALAAPADPADPKAAVSRLPRTPLHVADFPVSALRMRLETRR